MNSSKTKRNQKLRDLVSTSRRPIITRLNNDTSWLISIPIPSTPQTPLNPSSKSYYHILLDPWLGGPTKGAPAWLASLAHLEESSFKSFPDIDEAVLAIEEAANKTSTPTILDRRLDLLLISHHLEDHGQDLTDIDPRVPVLAQKDAANRIKKLKHFHTVEAIPPFNVASPDWRKPTAEMLPPWLGIFRWESYELFQDLHFAIMITISSIPITLESPELILYSPHSIYTEDALLLQHANPPLKTLAMLHGLDYTWFVGLKGGLGAHQGLKLCRLAGAKYWVRTHDEAHEATGVPKWILYRYAITIEEALEKEKEESGGKEMERPNYFELENGGCMLLE